LNTWRTFLLLLALAAVQVCGATDRPPNIVFIFADDWGWGDLGMHDSEVFRTPNIDRLAAQGTDFHQFSVNSPVCSPSRAAVLTGHFPERYRIAQHFATIEHHARSNMPDWLDPGAPLLPRILRDAGYTTGHFGKWHLTNIWVDDAPLPDRYGFDEFGAFNLPGENMPPAETADRAIDFIRRHKDGPFFLNLWIHETHTPHYPEPGLLKEFEGLSESEMVYAAVLAAGDRDVGKVMAVLDELELADDTIVIFSSDNGPESPNETRFMDDNATGPGFGRFYSVGGTAGLKGQKRSLYAGGVRVPFIVRWPGVVAAGKTDETSVVTAVDLLPTLVRVAGAELPVGYELDGEDVLVALRGETFKRSKPIYWVWPPGEGAKDTESPNWPHFGYQSGDWKLLVNSRLQKTELYRVSEDWFEVRDVSTEYPDVVDTLIGELGALRSEFPASPGASALSSLRKQNSGGEGN
jgi:N-acetylgalactosamine-6-sulfatase